MATIETATARNGNETENPHERRLRGFIEYLKDTRARKCTHLLRENAHSFCWGGLACDRFHAETGEGHWECENGSFIFRFHDGSFMAAFPLRVQRFFGISDIMAATLVFLNDNTPATFKDLGRIMEWYADNPEAIGDARELSLHPSENVKKAARRGAA